jgi:hypothetical protein
MSFGRVAALAVTVLLVQENMYDKISTVMVFDGTKKIQGRSTGAEVLVQAVPLVLPV